MKNKEAVYDKEISPLMKQIIDVCKEHKIAMVAQFSIPNDGDPDLRATTALTVEEYDPPKNMVAAVSLLKKGFMAFTTKGKE